VIVSVKNKGYALAYASLELQNNYKIVMEAIKKNGDALRYASLELQNNYKIAIEAVKSCRWSLKYTSLELRNNYGIVMEAVKNSGLKYCSNILQNNYFIIFAAIKTCEEENKQGYVYLIEIPFKYTNKYKTIEKIKELLEIYCETNKFKYDNFGGDFDLLIKYEL
jgi:hypothetical protein